MENGTPLDDADRAPWLAGMAADIDRWLATGQRTVLACSALKQRYRNVLIGDRRGVVLVHLTGPESLIPRTPGGAQEPLYAGRPARQPGRRARSARTMP